LLHNSKFSSNAGDGIQEYPTGKDTHVPKFYEPLHCVFTPLQPSHPFEHAEKLYPSWSLNLVAEQLSTVEYLLPDTGLEAPPDRIYLERRTTLGPLSTYAYSRFPAFTHFEPFIWTSSNLLPTRQSLPNPPLPISTPVCILRRVVYELPKAVESSPLDYRQTSPSVCSSLR